MATVIVVDAGVLLTALVDDGPDGRGIRARLRDERIAAPHLVDLEVTSALRGLVRAGRISAERAAQAIGDLTDIPLDRTEHHPLLGRCWQLRENLTTYDAAYVALAETLDAVLLTGDARLAHATGPRCRIEVVGV